MDLYGHIAFILFIIKTDYFSFLIRRKFASNAELWFINEVFPARSMNVKRFLSRVLLKEDNVHRIVICFHVLVTSFRISLCDTNKFEN
jgi:hypothetical protein